MFAARYATLLASFIFSQCASPHQIVNLTGDAWTLSNPELNVSVPAHLPSQAHLDLFANQVIGVSALAQET